MRLERNEEIQRDMGVKERREYVGGKREREISLGKERERRYIVP